MFGEVEESQLPNHNVKIYSQMFGREGIGEIGCLGKSICFTALPSFLGDVWGGEIRRGGRFHQLLYVLAPS